MPRKIPPSLPCSAQATDSREAKEKSESERLRMESKSRASRILILMKR